MRGCDDEARADSQVVQSVDHLPLFVGRHSHVQKRVHLLPQALAQSRVLELA